MRNAYRTAECAEHEVAHIGAYSRLQKDRGMAWRAGAALTSLQFGLSWRPRDVI